MAELGQAISSPQAKLLLQKLKNTDETGASKKAAVDLKGDAIIKELKRLNDTVKSNSKEAEENRKILIKELLKTYDDENFSIKEQKEKFEHINEHLNTNMDVIKSFDIKGLNKFIGLFSDMKALGTAITTSITNSGALKNITKDITAALEAEIKSISPKLSDAKALDRTISLIPKWFDRLSHSISVLQRWGSKVLDFINHPGEYLKSFGISIIKGTANLIEVSLKKFANFIWKNALEPILKGIYKVGAQVLAIGIDITTMLIKMAVSFVVWIVTTVVSLLFTIIGFLLFTVVPFLVSLFIEMVGLFFTVLGFILFTVIPLLVTILIEMVSFFVFVVIPFLISIISAIVAFVIAMTPVIIVAFLILLLIVVIVYLIWKFWDYVKEFYNYVVGVLSKVWDIIKASLIWVWDNVIKPVWDVLSKAFSAVWDYIKEFYNYVVGVLGKLWDTIKDSLTWVWNNIIKPIWDAVFNTLIWGWNNIILPIAKWLGEVFKVAWDAVGKPVFDWLSSVFMKAWDGVKIAIDWIKGIVDKIFGLVNKVGEGIQAVTGAVSSTAKSIGGGIASAWKWTTSFFAQGGIVTKPTRAMIGEDGTNEAVIPLNKDGMSFIRSAFGIDDTIAAMLGKDIQDMKFELKDIQIAINKISHPPERLSTAIKSDSLNSVEENPKQIFDIKDIEKLIMEHGDVTDKKLEMLLNMLKEMHNTKSDPLLNTGTSSRDGYQELIRAVSTGMIGVR